MTAIPGGRLTPVKTAAFRISMVRDPAVAQMNRFVRQITRLGSNSPSVQIQIRANPPARA
jgi:hypothetical protein